MAYVMVDVEADGPIPGDFSMICFGAVVVTEELDKTFYAHLKPVSQNWIPEALSVSGFTRTQTMSFDDPEKVMNRFAGWLKEHVKGLPIFISDNNGFDWQFINWYFWHYTGKNPFGHSSMNLSSLYKGFVKSTSGNFRHLRRTRHTHNPVDDAKGNAEALLAMRNVGLKIALRSK